MACNVEIKRNSGLVMHFATTIGSFHMIEAGEDFLIAVLLLSFPDASASVIFI